MQGNEIICPFQGCGMKYSVKSSFSSHLSRHHKETTNRQLLPDLVIGDQSSSTCNEPETPDITLDSNANYLNFDDCNSDISDGSDRESERELFLKNLALFYLKFSSKYHMPASTIQMVIEEIQAVHNVSQNCLKTSVSRKLKENSISQAVINEITEKILDNDLFNNTHTEKGPLSTDYRRKKYYKEHFNYVAPVAMRLGFDKQNKEQCYQYVPIIKTIEALLKDTSVKRQFNNPPVSQDGIL
jgi:hypothetical protein